MAKGFGVTGAALFNNLSLLHNSGRLGQVERRQNAGQRRRQQQLAAVSLGNRNDAGDYAQRHPVTNPRYLRKR